MAFFVPIAAGHMRLWILPLTFVLVLTACTPGDSGVGGVSAATGDGTSDVVAGAGPGDAATAEPPESFAGALGVTLI